jgi:glutathione S-transferase
MATPPAPATVIGAPVSPYVRKVLAVCALKGVPYQVDPIAPFFGNNRFSELNPLRRIPVYIDDQVSVSDSTVIREYLEERYPTPALLPKTPAERARARWIEEYADTRVGDIFIWRIFYEAVVAPSVWQRPRDKGKIARTVTEELPEVMDQLERLAPASGFLFGAASIADISVAVMFANLQWARVEIPADRWSRTTGWVERTTALPALAAITRIADALVRTPLPEQRRVAEELGLALASSSVQAAAPRRGPMTAP